MTMDQGFSVVGADRRRSEPDTLDAKELAREMRQLAVDAHEILNRPAATAGELVRMRRRSWELLHGARASQLSEIERWLRSAVRKLDAKLLSDPWPSRKVRRAEPPLDRPRWRGRTRRGAV
jgi:hypothetical protein